MSPAPHIPVLLDAVVAALDPRPGAVLVDGTFGAGGYSTALLQAAPCHVYAIDRDPRAIAIGRRLEREFPGRLTVIKGCFADMAGLLAPYGIAAVDGVVLDIGVSSMQLDEAERGFSFRQDGPLDMRMSQDGPSAADLVNREAEASLADIIFRYGEERRSRAVARAIVAARAEAPITRTAQLAQIVAGVVRAEPGLHPATRTFQALRIAVNDELGELSRALLAAERLLKPHGRLGVVTFHSLEDRVVKQFLDRRSGKGGQGSRHQPLNPAADRAPSFRVIHKGGVTAGAAECAANPRARSARLRDAQRTEAAPWPGDSYAGMAA